jgi:hypothetical protein
MKRALSHPLTKNLPAKVIQSYKSTFLPNIIQRAIPIKQISQAIMNHNINNMQFVGRNVQKDFNFRISLLLSGLSKGGRTLNGNESHKLSF